ncbi:MAG TPA: GNAT family N-acetyltransferase [Actinomycetes bacterium]|nr:GNAT family N-acetyltransferase [Actinomycetes bacterium]
MNQACAETPQPPPDLANERLTLRGWRSDERDVATVFRASRDAKVQKYSPSIGKVRSEADAQAWISFAINRFDRYDWAVECEGNTVGRVGLVRIRADSGEAEIGYWLLPEARGLGIASDAVAVVSRWAFVEGGFGRLEIRHLLDNQSSCGVAERCRFIAEGVQRGALLVGEVRYDLHLHARLATDQQ